MGLEEEAMGLEEEEEEAGGSEEVEGGSVAVGSEKADKAAGVILHVMFHKLVWHTN